MLIRLLFLSIFTFISSLALSSSAFAHAGVDHGDNCKVTLSGFELSLGGFQSEDKIGGGKHYCHIFPATGTVIFTFDEAAENHLKNKRLNLQFLAASSYWDLLFDYDNAFNQTITTENNSLRIEHSFAQAGLYALDITLPSTALEPSINNQKRVLFLVGYPIIKLLIFTALGFLIMLIIILLQKLKEGEKL